jgi:tetratricopeptide (TPR) repeat protein
MAAAPGASGTAISESRSTSADVAAPGSEHRPTVPRPDLSAMEEAAQQKVRLAQATLEQALRSGSLAPADLAEAFGFLGQLFHAYKLLDAAEASYEEAAIARPEDRRWHYLRGLAQFAIGDLEGSVESFSKALALGDRDLPTLIRLGNALIELNRAAEARGYFEQALDIDPDSAAALYGLGKALAMEGDDASAVRQFERALELQPQASIVHYPLGQAYRRLDEREKAVEHLRQRGQDEVAFPDPLGQQISRLAKGTALEVVIDMARDEESFSEKDFLGFALAQFGEVEGAAEQLEQWLELRGEGGDDLDRWQRARLHYVAGGLQANRGRDEEAAGHFQQAIELAPTLLDARVKLGNALARGGDFEGAIREYDGALEVDSENVDAMLKRAAARMELEQWGPARADLERLVELRPEGVEVRARLAAVFLQQEDLEGALEQYRNALDLELVPRERVQLTTRVAEILGARGEIEEAVSEYRAALEIDEEYIPAIAGLAGLLGSLGRFDESASLYARWAEVDPEAPRSRLGEATALIFARRYDEATSRLEAAIAAFPEIIDFKDVLARHLAACPENAARDGDRALVLAREVFEKVPTYESTETLAMAHAEAGEFGEAVRWQQRLIDEVGDEAPEDLLARLRANLARYENGEACCAEIAP